MQIDEIVLVKGVVDHKEGGTCVIVREVQRFDPSDAEIEKAREQAVKAAEPPKPLCLTLEGGMSAAVLEDLKRIIEDFPGESPLELRIGPRVVRLGEGYRVAARNASLKAELDRLLSPGSAPVPAHA